MKIATFNTNSIRARLPILTEWLDAERPDVVCLQETKVQDKDFPVSAVESLGYGAIYRGQKSYNGVAILSRHAMAGVSYHLSGEEEEARYIEALILDIPIINVYVPQGFAVGTERFQYKLDWLRRLIASLQDRYDPALPLVLLGDFNVATDSRDVFDAEKMAGEVGFHPDEQALMGKLTAWGLVDLFRKHHPEGEQYTFWDYRIPNAFKRKMGWRIDYILATPVLAKGCKRTWIDTEPRVHQKPSDHTFLIAELGL